MSLTSLWDLAYYFKSLANTWGFKTSLVLFCFFFWPNKNLVHGLFGSSKPSGLVSWSPQESCTVSLFFSISKSKLLKGFWKMTFSLWESFVNVDWLRSASGWFPYSIICSKLRGTRAISWCFCGRPIALKWSIMP
jgi:hypothetical protein